MARSFLDIRRNPLLFLERMRNEYGSIVQFPIPRPPTYLIADPEAARRVLVGNARNYGKRTLQYRALSLVTGEGLLTADTAEWRVQRRVVQPAFHHEAVAAVADHAAAAGQRLAERWTHGLAPGGNRVLDVDPGIMAASLEVVGSALFGADLSAEADELATATLAALDIVMARARVPISPPPWVPTPGNIRLRRAVHTLDEAVARLIAHRRAEPRSGEVPDLLDLLLADAEPGPRGEAAVRDQVVTFVVAGHETVASALTWALWLLAGDPEVLDRVEEEVDAVVSDAGPRLSDLPRLPWIAAVFDEALRLYPPAWLMTRRAHDADVLGGRRIPPGALLILSPYLVHRDPSAWPDPQRFDPRRFLGGETGPYWPFGAGPRQCIGRDFARLEAQAMLAALLRRIRPERIRGAADPVASPLVTIRPESGLHLRVVARSR